MGADDEVRAELRQLIERHGGRVTLEAVLDQARNPESALQGYITWDVDKAAHKYQILTGTYRGLAWCDLGGNPRRVRFRRRTNRIKGTLNLERPFRHRKDD